MPATVRTPASSLAALGLALGLAGFGLAACASRGFESELDREVTELLDERARDAVGGRAERVRQPEPAAPADAPGAAAEAPPVERAPLALGDALAIAVDTGRTFVTEQESLYLTALGLLGTRHEFSPQLSALLAYTFANGEGIERLQALGVNAGVSQILPQGGILSVDGTSDFVEQESGPDTFGSTVGVRLSQPLLRGAGYEVSHEALVQAERDVVYALRDFERFRERYSIDVARRYYDLVQQKQSLANQRRNLEGVLFGLRQAEALHAVERISELDVLRAKRQALNAENDLIQAEEAYELALDQFRVFLGLPENDEIDVQIDAPAFVPVSYDVESAIEVALENRLDIQNARERLEDSARDVRIAANRLLPDLDLGLGVDFAGDRATAFGRQEVDEERYTASLTLELPVDRVRERHSLRAAQIADRRVRRDFDEFIDAQIVDVRSTFRELERVRQSVEIQAELIADQERNVTIAQLQYERGDVSNREVVEAQDALLEARNSLIREQVNYEIARLELLRALGILFVDEHGMFR